MFAVWLLALLAALASADLAPFFNSDDYENGLFGTIPLQAYLSTDEFVGLVANVKTEPQHGVSTTPFVTLGPTAPKMQQKRPILMDANTFATAWIGPQASGHRSYVPRVHQCNGTNLMAWFAGEFPGGGLANRIYIMNEDYDILYNFSAIGRHKFVDLHEIYITPQCSAIITMHYEWGVMPIFLEEPRFNGTATKLYDSHFQEIDLATGELLFEWSASQAMPDSLDDSFMPYADSLGRWDWFHLNSIEKDSKGNYLLSARHTKTIYYVSGRDGSVIWRLGGKHSDFVDMSDGRATDFEWQHHVRWVDESHTRLTVFDNGVRDNGQDKARDRSRGLVLELDHWNREVRLQHEFVPSDELSSTRLGSVQLLKDTPGDETVMVGWGEEPAWTEYAVGGTVLADVRFGPPKQDRLSFDNYRALKTNWTGRPRWPPAIAPGPAPNYVFDSNTSTFSVGLVNDDTGASLLNDTVYFSWNGATEIDSWVVLASNTTSSLSVWEHYHSQVPKTGFEEAIFVGSSRYVAALAIAANNTVLGTTAVLDMHNVIRLSGPKGFNGTADCGISSSWQSFATYAGDRGFTNTLRVLYIAHPTLANVIAAVIVVAIFGLMTGLTVLWFRRRRTSRYTVVDDEETHDDDDDDSEMRERASVAEENDSMFSFTEDVKYITSVEPQVTTLEIVPSKEAGQA